MKRLLSTSALVLAHVFGRLALLASAIEAGRGHVFASAAWGAATAATYVVVRLVAGLLKARYEVELSRSLLEHVFKSRLFEPLRHHHEAAVVGLFDAARLEHDIKPSLVADVLVAIGVCVVAVTHASALRLGAFLGGLALGMCAVVAVRKRVWRASQRAWRMREAYAQSVLDGLEGAPDIVAFNATSRFLSGMTRTLEEARRASWVLGVESLVIGRVPVVAGVAVAAAVAYGVGGLRGLGGVLDWLVIGTLLAPFAGLAISVASYFEVRGATGAVESLLARPLRADGSVVPPAFSPIVLNAVDVEYAPGRLALHELTASIETGVTVLVGTNGSGKSTVLRAIAGLVTPSRGELRVDGVRGDDVAWQSLRARIAYLPQRAYLPARATVREAMAFLFDCDDATSRRALERIEAWSIVESKHADDPLACSVDELSAGERQRVAIARALARDADLYLLDEPDSNLDRIGVQRVAAIIGELGRRATVVVAAHTPEIVAVADRVIELDRGQVTSNSGETAPRSRAR